MKQIHEHENHPDFKFTVEIECNDPEWRNEIHALIYTDGYVAVTLYEYCYAIWYVTEKGELLGGNLWKKGMYRLSEESIKKINQFI